MTIQISSGDNLLGSINLALAELEALVTDFDGANIQAGTVATAALAEGKSFFSVGMSTDRDIFKGTGSGGANVTGIWGWEVPNTDGASDSSFKYLGASVSFGEFTTIHPAGALLRVKKNGSTIHDISLSNITAAGTPYQVNLATAVALVSGDVITVDYIAGATGDIQYATFVPHFSVSLVGT